MLLMLLVLLVLTLSFRVACMSTKPGCSCTRCTNPMGQCREPSRARKKSTKKCENAVKCCEKATHEHRSISCSKRVSLQVSELWRPLSHHSRSLSTGHLLAPNVFNERQRHGVLGQLTREPEHDTVKIILPRERAHGQCQDSEFAADQYFNIRYNPLLSTLPCRQPDRCSTHLPPAPCCSSRGSRSAQYFYTALGWRCPLHPTPLPHTPGSGARGCSSFFQIFFIAGVSFRV